MAPPVESKKTRNPSTAIVGVVVAGGASSRFGSDKALAMLDGETLVERAHRTVRGVCEETIVADAGRGIVEGVDSVPDGPGQGPIAAVLGAARYRPGRPLLVLACDLPLISAALLRRIAAEAGDWVVPRHAGGLEPLCALYRPPALEALAANARRGVDALHRLADALASVRYLDADSMADLGDPRELFANVNTPEELRRLAARLRRGGDASLG
jgi:molybdopterin-guanine dinucleotide biosynthesis protein A